MQSPASISAKEVNGEAHDSNPALVLQLNGSFTFEERKRPILPSPKYVLVRVIATGICGSDVHYWKHGAIGEFKVESPIILGHESAGIVEECGSEVHSLSPGDRVALEPGDPCRTCKYCRGGKYNLCPSMKFAATPPYDGTLSRFYTLPEDFCFKLPEQVSFEEGALVEPLSVAVHCVKLAGIKPASTVFILGAGPIGLLCSAVARAFGASTILVTDVVQSRLDFALSYAATHTSLMVANPPEVQAQELQEKSDVSDGFDFVIDATGVESCIRCGVAALARGGTFVQAGLGKSDILYPVGLFASKEAIYKSSFRYGAGDYQLAIDLIKTGKVSVKELITHRYQFEDSPKAFEAVSTQKGIKTVIYGPGIALDQEIV